MSKLFSIGEIASIFEERHPVAIERRRYFSVLMPLVEKNGETHVLFEVRAQHMKTQPGEVCFPGGRIESGETSRECAVRETCEELGIRDDEIQVFCQLDTSRNAAGSTIYRFLGQIEYETLQRVSLSREEVDRIFLVPLSFFLENEPSVMTVEIGPIGDYREQYRAHGLGNYEWGATKTLVPFYHYPGYPDYPIWGLTGRMMQNFVRILRQARSDEVREAEERWLQKD